MEYLGRAYKEADVQVGDAVKVISGIDGYDYEYIATVVDPRDIKEDNCLSGNCNSFVYLIIQKVIKGNYAVGSYDGWPSIKVIKLNNQKKVNFSNNCPECNISGEYINGAFKCPLCWKVW